MRHAISALTSGGVWQNSLMGFTQDKCCLKLLKQIALSFLKMMPEAAGCFSLISLCLYKYCYTSWFSNRGSRPADKDKMHASADQYLHLLCAIIVALYKLSY